MGCLCHNIRADRTPRVNARPKCSLAGRTGKACGKMPLQQSTKANLVINLKTAKALRIWVPALLGRADRVIE
jgi:hypothetical protein